jgi:hypothetical protein
MGEGSTVFDGRHCLVSTVAADGSNINYRISGMINIDFNKVN